MKTGIKDILFGILIFLAVLVCEFLVTLPFGEIAEVNDRAQWAMLINREFLMTALPAALITFAFSFFLKTASKKAAVRRGTIWASVFALFYIFIGIGNQNLELIFGNIGIYVLLACVFMGAVLYPVVKRFR